MEQNLTVSMGLAGAAFLVNILATVITVSVMIGRFANSVNVSIAVLQRDVSSMVQNHISREEWVGYKAEREARLAPVLNDVATLQAAVIKLQDRHQELSTQLMLVISGRIPPKS